MVDDCTHEILLGFDGPAAAAGSNWLVGDEIVWGPHMYEAIPHTCVTLSPILVGVVVFLLGLPFDVFDDDFHLTTFLVKGSALTGKLIVSVVTSRELNYFACRVRG